MWVHVHHPRFWIINNAFLRGNGLNSITLLSLYVDESFEVEQKCQQVISEMEEVLGESLQKYF